MDGGRTTTTTVQESLSMANGICDELSILCINGDKDELILEKVEKDPRRIARKYQIELCKKAKEENVIVYMGTGCGKTHIAVLLIYEMGHRIKKPQKDVCIFLAPTVALVQQQAKVIEKSIDFKVGTYCGSSSHFKGRTDWEKELGEYEVLVMTPQILLHYLSHCFIKLELIALLIFDECHYAQHESNHPYAEIMKIFYKKDLVKLPRIFGMTASPKLGKAGSIDGLEALLRAKVYCVENKDELDRFVTSPKVTVYYYDSVENGYSCAQAIYSRKLDEIRHQCASTFRVTTLDQNSLRNSKKLLQKLHSNLKFCLENLGIWGALQASNILLKGDHYENTDVLEGTYSYSEDNLLKKKYLNQAESILSSECSTDATEADMSSVEVLKEPIFSRKLLRLIDILLGFRSQPNMKCIIFVNRIITARSLSYILRSLKFLSSWKCGFLVGVHTGLVSRKNTGTILEKFRSGELNLLVATKVGEEGLDIQTCCLVIRFDLPETVASFIQSRGRARMPQSEYAFLVDRANPGDVKLIDHFKKDEDQMNAEISSRKSIVPMDDFEGSTYQVESTGATISSIASISLLHRYCSKLPHDEYFTPKPQFFPVDSSDGMTCTIILPANAPIHEVTSSPQSSAEEARRDACLKACKALHEVGALTDYLLPEEYSNSDNESTHDFSDSESCDDDDARTELHKMLIPAALREPWSDPGSYTCFSSYYIEICPDPADRIYRKFGIYVKSSLPEGAERMKLDLCLARGRMVKTQLIPSGVARLDKDEVASAEKYQRMFLKAILDRESLKSEFVSLEDNDDANESNSSTFYLMLPVIQQEDEKISIDWTLIKRCLSSPIFRQLEMSYCVSGVSQLKKNRLHLANGYRSVDDVVNSFVYVPCKNTFYFISDIFPERNGLSMFDESETHSKHCMTRYNIHLLHPYQPLLKAKQLFVLDNLLRKRKHKGDWRDKEEHFIELPPEICQLKIIGFSKDIGSSLSLLPSIMHRLESFLVAIELKDIFAASFPEGAEVTHDRILEALTTERCAEHFSLERLEVLGDAFLKLAAGRYVFLKHYALDEGQLTRKRSNIVSNSNLFKLAKRNNLQVYIRDAPFEADQFYAFGRPCPVRCNKENEKIVHPRSHKHIADVEVQCNQSHHWLQKKTIADVVEAITGAFIVDSGFKAAIAFLNWLGIQVDFMPSQVDNIRSESKIFVPLSDKIDVSKLESILGYKFGHKGLLIQAFIHPSFNEHLGGCYQRLEFLGDALLDYLITSYLYSVYPKLKPGQLTDLRSAAVNNISFADVAGRCSFHKYILCDSSALLDTMNKYVSSIGKSASARGHDEEKSCPKALGDLVESCMGAIYLDTGFDLKHSWNIVLSLLSPIISPSKLQFNPLRGLMELAQSYYWELKFSSVKKDGKFTVEVKVDEKNVSITTYATDVSGKAAKRKASRELFERLKALGYKSKSKSLEEVLRKSEKKQARLIGYDESPSHGTTKSCHIEVHKALHGNHDVKVHTPNWKLNKVARPIRQSPGSLKSSEPQVKQSVIKNGHVDALPSIKLNNSCTDTQGTVSPPASAKSHLYEACTANCWKPPIFECCNETGPSHLKEFLFKVILEMEEFPNEIFEFYGEPRLRKKDAAELAAEGALWYLKHEGYILDKKTR